MDSYYLFCLQDNYLVLSNNRKNEMEIFLQDKYGKEFVVESIDYYYQYFGAPHEIKGVAYPKDDKQLKFDVREFTDGHLWWDGNEYSKYNEKYLLLLWEKQTKKQITEKFNTLVVITDVSAPIYEIYTNSNKKTPSIDELIELFNKKITLSIWCGIFTNNGLIMTNKRS